MSESLSNQILREVQLNMTLDVINNAYQMPAKKNWQSCIIVVAKTHAQQ